jgi:pimeloyl-ACP methyl ester carboxylesterase
MTIAALAERDPGILNDRAQALAMLNTGVGDVISEALVIQTPERLASLREWIGELVFNSSAPLAIPDAVLVPAVRYLALTPQASEEAVALTAEMVRVTHPESRSGFAESMTRMELYEALASIELPTIVVCGERDRLLPPVHSRRLAEEIGGQTELVELERIGHMAPLEAPERISALIADVARRHLPARPRTPVA